MRKIAVRYPANTSDVVIEIATAVGERNQIRMDLYSAARSYQDKAERFRAQGPGGKGMADDYDARADRLAELSRMFR